MTNRELLCKEFTLLVSGQWCEWSKECGGSYAYVYGVKTTYENSVDVLKVMMMRDDFRDFIHNNSLRVNYHAFNITDAVIKFCAILTKPDDLLKSAVKFLKEKKNEGENTCTAAQIHFEIKNEGENI